MVSQDRVSRMNEVRLYAKTSRTPSLEERQKIESELRSFLLEFHPTAELTVEQREGSWQIVLWGSVSAVGGWLLLQSAAWAWSKLLDRVAQKGFASEQEEESGSTEEVDSSLGEEDIALAISQIDQLEMVVDRLDGLATRLSLDRVRYSEYSNGIGRIASLNYEEGRQLDLHQTDSIDDFKDRTDLS